MVCIGSKKLRQVGYWISRVGRLSSVALLAITGFSGASSDLFAQPQDSLVTAAAGPEVFPADTVAKPHSPRGAMFRALVAPGWGQIYNKQLYKLPFVYGALAGTTIFAARNYRLHRDARHAFLYATGMDSDPNPYAEYEDAYSAFEGASADRLFDHKNSLRRNRDLSFFSIGVVYLLSVLDAYVSGHLFDFETSEDLTIRVAPVPEGATVVVAIRW